MAASTCTCGATLPEPDAVGLITCPSCGRVTRADDPPPATSASGSSDSGSAAWPAPPVIAPTPGGAGGGGGTGGSDWLPPGASGTAGAGSVGSLGFGADPLATAGKVMKAGRGCSIAVTLLIFLAVIGGVVFAVTKGKDAVQKALNSTSNDITLAGSGRVIASKDGQPTEMAVMVQHYKDGTHRYIARLRVSAQGFDEVWRSPELPSDAYNADVAVVGDTMFVGVKEQLWALRMADGKKRWDTTMRNSLTTSCDDCLAAVEGKVIVRTNDAYLVGYAPESPEPLWSRRLNSTSSRPTLVGGHYYLTDDSSEQGQPGRVHSVNPATGADRRSVAPVCSDSDAYSKIDIEPDTQIHPVAGTKDLVAVFGFGNLCVARWDSTTGQIRYARKLAESSSIDQDETAVGPTDLVIASSGEMVHIALADGRDRVLAPAVDQEAAPAQIVGRILVTTTRTTRGDQKGGFAGWSLDTGQRVWSVQAPGGAQAASPIHDHTSDALFEGQPRSVLAGAGKNLSIVTFDGQTKRVTIESLDPLTGKQGSRRSAQFGASSDSGTPSLSIEAVGPNVIVYTVQTKLRLLALDSGDAHVYPGGD